jgi:hypothetical protein
LDRADAAFGVVEVQFAAVIGHVARA